MVALNGYLVVLKAGEDERDSPQTYRGISRRPLWSDDLYAEGFRDPYVFGDYVDEHGLIQTLELAHAVAEKFRAVIPDELEIIQVVEVLDGAESSVPTMPGSFGLDVALREASFWSMIDDYPPDDWAQEFLTRLNRNRLFDSARDAMRFKDQCLRVGHPYGHETDQLAVWRVTPVA